MEIRTLSLSLSNGCVEYVKSFYFWNRNKKAIRQRKLFILDTFQASTDTYRKREREKVTCEREKINIIFNELVTFSWIISLHFKLLNFIVTAFLFRIQFALISIIIIIDYFKNSNNVEQDRIFILQRRRNTERMNERMSITMISLNQFSKMNKKTQIDISLACMFVEISERQAKCG